MRPGSRAVAAVLASVGLLLAPALPGASAERAEPAPQDKLRKLTRQAAALNKAYRGQVQSLEEVRLQAKKAATRAQNLGRRLAAAEREVVKFAQTTYMGGSLDSAQLFAANGDPTDVLGHAATVSHLASERARKLQKVKDLVAEAKKARKAAQDRIGGLEREIRTLRGKRREVEKLLAKYGFQTPGGSDGLTPRMVAVRNAVLAQFPMPYGYGCLRPGDPGEHGSGRACDFMLSGGGRMPNQIESERGDALAQWAIQNGSRFGIMYIIWKQRYYDIRTGAGWRPMSDRGSITANHWDHVHISVF